MRNLNHKLHRSLFFVLLLAALAYSTFAPVGGNGAAAAGLADTNPGAALAAPAQALTAALTSQATTGTPHIFPAQGQAASQADPQTVSNLAYHGGPVEGNFAHNVYVIFWGTQWSADYKSRITTYFQDVAHDSQTNRSSNVYYASTQYYRTDTPSLEHVSYKQTLAGVFNDNTLMSSHCNDTHGGTLRCYTNAEVVDEVYRAIQVNHWPMPADGQLFINNLYMVVLGDNLSLCIDSSCQSSFGGGGTQGFCAYHGVGAHNNRGYIFAALPFDYHVASCKSGNYPNNSPAADSEVSTISHEHSEILTDPLSYASAWGDPGWYDAHGNEIGDKCAWNFGTQLGGTPGHEYNQVINGHHYELQQEWSNHSSRCVLHGW